jgi:hypothetical protein
MINSEHFEPGRADLTHQLDDLLCRYFIACGSIDGDIFGRKRAPDDSIPAGEQAAAFDPRILARMADHRLQHVGLNSNRGWHADDFISRRDIRGGYRPWLVIFRCGQILIQECAQRVTSDLTAKTSPNDIVAMLAVGNVYQFIWDVRLVQLLH